MKNSSEKKDSVITLIETGDYITTVYGLINYYKCVVCRYNEILNADNFCPHCGRKVINYKKAR